MKNLTWQNPEQLFVAQVLIKKVKLKCCGIKVYDVYLLQGECRAIFLKELIEILETDNQWENYVSEVKIWAQARKTELGLV